jgi:hypothetical protein
MAKYLSLWLCLMLVFNPLAWSEARHWHGLKLALSIIPFIEARSPNKPYRPLMLLDAKVNMRLGFQVIAKRLLNDKPNRTSPGGPDPRHQ